MIRYELAGKKFNKLTVLEVSDKKSGRRRYWKCKCDCGEFTQVETSKLISGWTKSCGCLYRDDMLGFESGKLKVIRFDGTESNHAYWICQCKCGNTTRLNTHVIKSGHTKSCGCSHNAGKENCQWNGVGDMSGCYWLGIIKREDRKNRKVEITKEYAWNLFLKQERKCAFSSVELKFESKQGNRDGTASLDRIDSSKGYIEGNVQWIHKDLNWMKQDFDDEYFIRMCGLVYNNSKKYKEPSDTHLSQEFLRSKFIELNEFYDN